MAQSLFNERAREGIGGSHTVVTAVPLDALEPIDPKNILANIAPVREPINLYAHIAACEHICPFCHYATVKTDIGQEADHVQAYMNGLWQEIDFWAEKISGTSIASIYLGGGTPTALSEVRLISTLERLQLLSASPISQICVETSPRTLMHDEGHSKLQSLMGVGVNRISMGLQSFDEGVLQATRGHGQKQALDAVERLAISGVNYNIDLIQDLQGQTEESLLSDIAFVEKFKPPQVTWYICRLHEGSIWHKKNQSGRLGSFPSSEESIERRQMLRERMAEIGYTADAGGRFVLNAVHDTYKAVRGGADTTLLGIGLSAYSHGWGWFFRNSSPMSKDVNLTKYADIVATQGHAIQSGYKMQAVDYLAARVTTGIRTAVTLPESASDPKSMMYLQQAQVILASLETEGFVERLEDRRWSMTQKGHLFEEEICALFYTQDMRDKLVRMNRLSGPNLAAL